MPTPPLLQRLKERKLVQWALAYLAGAWVLVESSNLVVDRFHWPEAIGQGVIVIAFFGFLLTLVLAWYHGEKGRQRVSGPELLIVAALLVVTGGVLSMLGPDGETAPRSATQAIALRDLDRPSTAVLPCDNIGGDPEDAYFTDGIHDEIITQLHKLSGLAVTSRTSVLEYREPGRSIGEIAGELGVSTVLECSVRRGGGRVRITAQLIDADTDRHIWVDSYDREYLVENILDVQIEIARAIANALSAALTPREEQELQQLPTNNLEAYDFYLRGVAYWDGMSGAGYTEESLRYSLEMFEQALDLDPGFALAYSWLARVNVFMVNMSYGDREEHMAIARGAIARALELAPDLPEAHLALGYYYRWLPDLDQALREVAIAEEGRPGDPEVFWAKATTLWQLERWDEAVDLQFRVVALDPRNPASLRVLGTWLKDLRRYDEAEQNLGLSLRLQPDRVEAQYYLASIPWAREGDPEPLRQWSTKQDLPTVPWSGAIRWQAAVFARDYEAALNVLQSMDVEFERWTPHFPRPLLEGLTHRFLGNPELAQAAFEAARLVLEDGVRHQPGDPTVRRALALAYAGLGMREEAVREARVVADLLPGFRVPSGFEDWGFVWVYSLLGDDARAVEHLDSLLASPVGPSVNEVRADPFFDDLHSNRRFQALLERYADALEH